MWVFLNKAALSVVADRDRPGFLLVRARVAGDIEAVFQEAETWVDEAADYRYRASLPRLTVASALYAAVADIDYPDFKGSVSDELRHLAYLGVWSSWRQQAEWLDADEIPF